MAVKVISDEMVSLITAQCIVINNLCRGVFVYRRYNIEQRIWDIE